MSLLDIIIPYRTVVINQSIAEKSAVSIDAFGLNTEDFVYLVDGYKTVLASIFLRNAKEDLKNIETSKEILGSFPEFAAACVACGCRQRDAQEYIRQLPFPIQIELLSTIFELTFPEGLKKSLEKLMPTILQLLKK
ncbi:phage pre-tape measure protein [Pseudomonas fluorescens]|uniref:Uncharacterized protein n=1 Tax=Pseudomonas fluorescens TaxID=294 RepID=A0A0F4VEU3_PSEFL|nr:hypothetical protein [Pseudomonas fluorescens]KJZ67244.1 hypothetical protein VD17_02995 [Pseudomonas fluorescens]